MTSEKLTLPEGFLFGFATGHYQIEGSTTASKRGPSIWDTFTHKDPSPIADGTSGDNATDSFRRWKSDIALLKSYGANSYRFSISWSRIIPAGGRNDKVNPEGIKFYRDILEELVRVGITPCVVRHLCFMLQNAEARVINSSRHFTTGIYPKCCMIAMAGGLIAKLSTTSFITPRPASKPSEISSSTGYVSVSHNLILSHGYAVKLYRDEFKAAQGGSIGITLDCVWYMPYDQDNQQCVEAAKRALDTRLGRTQSCSDPIYKGHYPAYLVSSLGDRLPKFTPEEVAVVHGSSDFFGLNTYTSNLVQLGGGDEFNGKVKTGFVRPDGTQLGTQGQEIRTILYTLVPALTYPPGFRALLNYLWKTYKKPVYVTENGFAVKDENKLTANEAIHDVDRVDYYRGYTRALLEAVNVDGVDIKSYSAWSLLDNFEWAEGYQVRFGVTFVAYETQERFPKDSSRFLKEWFEKYQNS
ncbi:beta-glucosidase 1A [Lyophyllum atratum]|nr:beta-glucosidase 1A [Lyophyllum atratum]